MPNKIFSLLAAHPLVFQAKSLGHRKWWPESEQDFGQRSGKFYHGGFFIPPKGHRMAVNPFSGWSVVVLLDDLEDREKVSYRFQGSSQSVSERVP